MKAGVFEEVEAQLVVLSGPLQPGLGDPGPGEVVTQHGGLAPGARVVLTAGSRETHAFVLEDDPGASAPGAIFYARPVLLDPSRDGGARRPRGQRRAGRWRVQPGRLTHELPGLGLRTADPGTVLTATSP
jgi:hypothetical protein